MINQYIKDSQAYNTYYDFATGKVLPRKARKYKKVASPSRKLSPVKEAEPVKKTKRVKRPTKKSTTAATVGVVFRDTLGVFVSKKKAPAKGNKGKGMEFLSDATLLEASQVKEAIQKNDNNNDSNDDSKGDNDKADSDDDGNSDADDNERTDSNDDENPSFILNDYDEEEHDEEYESDDDNENVFEDEDNDLYKDVDMRSLGVKQGQERKDDEEMTDADHNVSQEKSYEQVIEDAHMTLTSSQKTDSLNKALLFHQTLLANFLSWKTFHKYATRITLETYTKDFEKKAHEERMLYIDVVEESVKEIIKDEVKSRLPQILPKEVSDFVTPVIQSTINESLENVERSESYKNEPEHKELYKGLVKSYNLDKDLFSAYGNVYSLKRDHDNKDKDEDPSAGSDQGLKKQKTNKDIEPPKGSKSKESKTSSSKGTKSQPKSSGKSVQAEELVFETADTKMPQDQRGHTEDQHNNDGKSIDSRPPQKWIGNIAKARQPPRTPPQKWIGNIAKARQPPRTFDELRSTPIDFLAYVMYNLKINNLTQEILTGLAFNLLKETFKSFVELEYYFEECYKAVTDQLDWNNPKGHEYPFDLSKSLSLIEAQGHQVVLADYFFNNDLEYLKGKSSSRKYTTSITKTKAAKYDNIKGVKDMVSELWSPVKVAYDKFTMKKIIVVTHVKVIKWYDYSYLEEIIVRREDQTLHKFKRNMLMRSDELYNFYDGTLTSVRRVLHDIANNLRMDYLPKRRWSNLDQKRENRRDLPRHTALDSVEVLRSNFINNLWNVFQDKKFASKV
nr:hypothetical protein [Tanacetum cinerariifolium]